MPYPQNPDQFLMGAGVRSAKFTNYGDTVTGRVVDSRISQQTDIKTQEPLSWPNGDPKLQLVVTLQTSLREDDEDDGLRNLYVKGSQKPGSRSLHAAVADAVRAAGAKALEEGGLLSVTYEADESASTPGLTDRKLYRARFQRAQPQDASGVYLGTNQPQDAPQSQYPPQPPTWGQPPAQQQPPQYPPASPPMPPQEPNGWQQQPAAQQQGVPTEDDLERFRAWQASGGAR